jgi:Protein of unknown function (DUF3780)
MSEKPPHTIGFGCPDATDPHHFQVEIPAGRNATVLISEHYGIKAGINGLPEVADRCCLPRAAWAAIAEDVKREFNERLRSKKLEPGRWTVGANRVERLLGKELLVLAWAIEECDPALYGNAVRNWTGLRPEERWWLHTMTAAATGRPEDAGIGWRKALRFALTENPLAEPMVENTLKPRPVARRRTKAEATSVARLPGFEDEESPFSTDGKAKLGREPKGDR